MKQRPLRSLLAPVQNESGIMTLDFLFAFTLVFSLTLVMLALSLTLSVIEITQYVTFATARNYMAAHVTPQLQEELGRSKFQELTAHPVFAPLYRAGWFQLGALELGLTADQRFLEEYGDTPTDSAFTGARVSLNAKVLEIRIPFFGNTFDNEDGFVTRISSFLLREPTQVECMRFNAERFRALLLLNSAYQQVRTGNQYRVMGDNGC